MQAGGDRPGAEQPAYGQAFPTFASSRGLTISQPFGLWDLHVSFLQVQGNIKWWQNETEPARPPSKNAQCTTSNDVSLQSATSSTRRQYVQPDVPKGVAGKGLADCTDHLRRYVLDYRHAAAATLTPTPAN